MRRTLSIILALLFLLQAPKMRAASSIDARADQLFEQSAEAYNRGEFQRAVELLKEAYRLKPDPVLLYNLARAYEGLGDLPNGLASYQAYLTAQPNAEDAGAVASRIAALKKQLDDRAAIERERLRRATAPTPPPEPSVAPWILGGVGAAAALTGTVFAGLALARHDAALSEPRQTEAARVQSNAKTFAVVADVTWIAGGVLLAAGLIWGVVGARAPTEARSP